MTKKSFYNYLNLLDYQQNPENYEVEIKEKFKSFNSRKYVYARQTYLEKPINVKGKSTTSFLQLKTCNYIIDPKAPLDSKEKYIYNSSFPNINKALKIDLDSGNLEIDYAMLGLPFRPGDELSVIVPNEIILDESVTVEYILDSIYIIALREKNSEFFSEKFSVYYLLFPKRNYSEIKTNFDYNIDNYWPHSEEEYGTKNKKKTNHIIEMDEFDLNIFISNLPKNVLFLNAKNVPDSNNIYLNIYNPNFMVRKNGILDSFINNDSEPFVVLPIFDLYYYLYKSGEDVNSKPIMSDLDAFSIGNNSINIVNNSNLPPFIILYDGYKNKKYPFLNNKIKYIKNYTFLENTLLDKMIKENRFNEIKQRILTSSLIDTNELSVDSAVIKVMRSEFNLVVLENKEIGIPYNCYTINLDLKYKNEDLSNKIFRINITLADKKCFVSFFQVENEKSIELTPVSSFPIKRICIPLTYEAYESSDETMDNPKFINENNSLPIFSISGIKTLFNYDEKSNRTYVLHPKNNYDLKFDTVRLKYKNKEIPIKDNINDFYDYNNYNDCLIVKKRMLENFEDDNLFSLIDYDLGEITDLNYKQLKKCNYTTLLIMLKNKCPENRSLFILDSLFNANLFNKEILLINNKTKIKYRIEGFYLYNDKGNYSCIFILSNKNKEKFFTINRKEKNKYHGGVLSDIDNTQKSFLSDTIKKMVDLKYKFEEQNYLFYNDLSNRYIDINDRDRISTDLNIKIFDLLLEYSFETRHFKNEIDLFSDNWVKVVDIKNDNYTIYVNDMLSEYDDILFSTKNINTDVNMR